MGSCESRETASGPARKYQSEQTEMKNTEDLRRDNTISKPKKQLNRSDFTQYYEHIKKILKTRKFKFSEPNDKTTFLTKLANSHDIDNNTAKSWIHMYVDYMIFVAWQNAYSKRSRTIYPPYAIQQVAKLHATYTQNYIYFCRIITESKDIINLAPYKIIAKQITNDPDSLKNAYNSTKDFIWHQVYINLGVRKSEEAKKQAEAVWEPFEQTFFKNEFAFSFLGASDVEEFIIKLSKYQKQIELKSKDFSEIIRSADILRDLMGIKNLIKTPGQLKLSLANKFLEPSNSTGMDAFSEVEAIPVTTEFVNVLAWEYRISIDMALDWILEYKKFLFLFFAYERKMRVSPSEIVDRVWHLHLQFTHDYHENIFKTKKFSHKPLKNDETEVNQQPTIYKKTLKAYAKYFGPPDPVIWPNNNIGFPESGIIRSFEWFFSSKLMTTEEKAKMLRMRTYQKRKDMVSERSVPDQTTSGDPNIDLAPNVAVVSVESGFLKDSPSF